MPRDDEEFLVARHLCNDVVSDPIREVSLLGVAGHVLEGKDGN